MFSFRVRVYKKQALFDNCKLMQSYKRSCCVQADLIYQKRTEIWQLVIKNKCMNIFNLTLEIMLNALSK